MDENPYKGTLAAAEGPIRPRAKWRKWLPAAGIIASPVGVAVGCLMFLLAFASGYNRMEGEFVSLERQTFEAVVLFGSLWLMGGSVIVGVASLFVLMVRFFRGRGPH
jgi:hypothetical protein